MKDIKKWKRRW